MTNTTIFSAKGEGENVRLLFASKVFPDPNHRQTFSHSNSMTYTFALVSDGEGTLTVNDTIYPLIKNTLFCVFPNTEVTISANQEFPYTIYSITLECSHLENTITLKPTSPVTYLRSQQIERLIQSIYKSVEAQTMKEHLRAIGYAYTFLSTIADNRPISQNKRGRDIASEAISYINDNYTSAGLTITSIAEYLHLNRTYFSEVFKKETGMTAISYINDLRLKKALNLLLDTNLTVAQIAEEIGMDFVWFSKIFKSQYGSSPAKFRSTKRAPKTIENLNL